MIRIATWNVVGTGKGAWAYVVSALPADVYDHNSSCIRWEPNSDNRGKGIAIYTRGFLLVSVPFSTIQGERK